MFTNPVGSTTTAPATLTVTAAVPVTITTTTLHTGSVYQNDQVRVLGHAQGVRRRHALPWSLKSGKLPRGLTLSSTGVISGKATTAGTETFVVKVVDTKTSVTPQTSATKKLSITIK